MPFQSDVKSSRIANLKDTSCSMVIFRNYDTDVWGSQLLCSPGSNIMSSIYTLISRPYGSMSVQSLPLILVIVKSF